MGVVLVLLTCNCDLQATSRLVLSPSDVVIAIGGDWWMREYRVAASSAARPTILTRAEIESKFSGDSADLVTLSKSAEILTTPRYAQAHDLQYRLARATQENKWQADDCFSPVDITNLIYTNEREVYARELSI